jgi:hypothetical protein
MLSDETTHSECTPCRHVCEHHWRTAVAVRGHSSSFQSPFDQHPHGRGAIHAVLLRPGVECLDEQRR